MGNETETYGEVCDLRVRGDVEPESSEGLVGDAPKGQEQRRGVPQFG